MQQSKVVALKRAVGAFTHNTSSVCITHIGEYLITETVESASLTFQGVDDIHSGDSRALGMFSIGNCITDDVLKEDLKATTGLFVSVNHSSGYLRSG